MTHGTSHRIAITAIMPTYNDGPYIQAAIQSIINQTFENWELIVVDDGSTDDTQEILSRISDPRMTIVRMDRNIGPAAARNHAIKMAMGRYIAITDSDDISAPERFAKQIEAFDRDPGLDVVASQMMYFWENQDPRPLILYPQKPQAIRERFSRGRMAIAHAAVMIRRDIFFRYGCYETECRRAQDIEFFLRIHQQCTFETLPDFLVLYRHELKRIPLRNWIKDLDYERYAVYLAAQSTDSKECARPLTFEEFTKGWKAKLQLHTNAWPRYINYRLRTERSAPHRLR